MAGSPGCEQALGGIDETRPRHSKDHGLVESKNGAVIRKHIGYGYIASRHAEAIRTFYRERFNPYLNFHRPVA